MTLLPLSSTQKFSVYSLKTYLKDTNRNYNISKRKFFSFENSFFLFFLHFSFFVVFILCCVAYFVLYYYWSDFILFIYVCQLLSYCKLWIKPKKKIVIDFLAHFAAVLRIDCNNIQHTFVICLQTQICVLLFSSLTLFKW